MMCKHCGGTLVQKQTKQTAAQLKKPYYYSAYYYCPQCHRLYHDDKFKVTNKVSHPELGSGSSSPLLDTSVILSETKNLKAPSAKPQDDTIYDVEIWTDGACVHNGTPRARAAWGFVSGKTERTGLVEGVQTNNRAEGLAIYHALVWAAEKNYRKIKLHTDSQISLYGVKKPPHLVKANRDIFEDIDRVIKGTYLQVEFIKVLGHSGDPNNDRVDKLANDLARKGS
jgi:ribonuclease HI